MPHKREGTTMIRENKDVYKLHATMKRAMLWVSGNDRAWFRDFFKTCLDREAGTITYTWPMFDEEDNELTFTTTIRLTDETGELSVEAMYRNAIEVFVDKARTFMRVAQMPGTNPDAAWTLRYHAENLAVIADIFNDAYYFENGVSLAEELLGDEGYPCIGMSLVA